MKFTNSVDVFHILSSLDWWIFFGVLACTILSVLYGLFLRKKMKASLNVSSTDSWGDYILMGRQLTLPLFVATLVATWYGQIFGVTQIAYEHGVYSFLINGIFWYIAYAIFAFFLSRSIRRYQVLTFPELLEKLIGSGPAKAAAALVFLKTLPIAYGMSVGIFIQFVFGIPLSGAMAIGIGFVVFYSLFGGFRAVVFSDFIQFSVMYIGIISIVLFSYIQCGGYSYLSAHLPASHFSLTGEFSISTTFVWFFIALSTTFLNPTFYQRCFAAKTDNTAFWGILISILFWVGFDFCQLAIGLYAKAALPNATPTDACLSYALQILPVGWKGLFLAAVLATILSTLDSFLFISSTVLSYDLKIFKKLSPFQSHFYTLILTGVLTFFLAILWEGRIETAWKTLKGAFTACLFVPIVWCYIKPYSLMSRDFTISTICVLASMGVWTLYGSPAIDSFYVGNIVALGVIVGKSWYKKFDKFLQYKKV